MSKSPGVPARRIKALAVILLAVIIWPLPAMIGFSNPAEGVILGRYTTTYFLLLCGYAGPAVVWAAATIRLVTLSTEGFNRLRACLAEHLAWIGVLTPLLLVGAVALRAAVYRRWLALPGTFAGPMRVIPSLSAVLFVLLLLLLDAQTVQPVEDALNRWSRVARSRFSLVGRVFEYPTAWVVLGFAVLWGGFLAVVLRPAFWGYPLTTDSSVHVYLGQHILRGGVPYKTFVYSYPPGRYLISTLWSLGAQLSGLPVVHVVRGYNVLVALGIITLVYAVGFELTRSRLAGMLAAVIFFGFEAAQWITITEATFRLTTVFVILLCVWLAQRQHWLWSGVAGMFGLLVYQPVGIVLVAVGASALILRERRWQSLGRFAAGVGAMLLVTVLGLLLAGILQATVQQVIGTLVRVAQERLVDGAATGRAGGVGLSLRAFWWYVQWAYENDVELVALSVSGWAALLVAGRRPAWLRQPARSAVIFTTLLMLGFVMFFNSEGMHDIFLLTPLFCVGAAESGWLAVRWLEQRLAADKLQETLGAASIAFVLLLGITDSSELYDWLFTSATTASTTDYEAMGAQLNALDLDASFQCMINLWCLIYTDYENVVPVPRLQMGVTDSSLYGLPPGDLEAAVVEKSPAVILGWVYKNDDEADIEAAPQWLKDYEFVGWLSPHGSDMTQSVHVRADRQDIVDVVGAWPLVTP